MPKKSHKRKQKLYKMVGCSKKSCKTRKNYLGGTPDVELAYTGRPVPSVPNPFLAYTGKGGSSCGLSSNGSIPVNTNAANPTIPNTGAISGGKNTIYSNANQQRGGGCGCGLMSGGGKGRNGGSCPMCSMGFMVGGEKHRDQCKCSNCNTIRGGGMKGGNAGIRYPDGLVGTAWSAGSGPGVNGIPGDANYYKINTYKHDIPLEIKNSNDLLVMKGGEMKGGRRGSRQRGGAMSNLLGQDLINLGRQFQFGVGSAYNALAGYPAPVNPLPWKGQLPTNNLAKI